jgi:nucleoside-diphosphate-sugar epimerase
MSAPNVSGEVFNIACHEEHTVLDIWNGLCKILNAHGLEPVFKPKRPGDIRRSYADISKAKRLLGFKVQTRFYPGLQKTVDWFLSAKMK